VIQFIGKIDDAVSVGLTHMIRISDSLGDCQILPLRERTCASFFFSEEVGVVCCCLMSIFSKNVNEIDENALHGLVMNKIIRPIERSGEKT
jgi:Fe-S-cluster containining protein